MSDTKGTYYTAQELFEIFKEQHRLFSPLDPIADPKFSMQRDSLIEDWSEAMDLLEWPELAASLNSQFNVSIPQSTWRATLTPLLERTVWDVCTLLSEHAVKEITEPIRLFGHDCYEAAVFRRLKGQLRHAGADVSDIRPSSAIADYDKHLSLIVDEATRTGVHTFDQIEFEKLPQDGDWRSVVGYFLRLITLRRHVLTGNLRTFRDLVERIVEARPLGTVHIPSTAE